MAVTPVNRGSEGRNRATAPEDHETPTISRRKTDEIVFAFVGPVGSGVSYTARKFQQAIEAEYGYTPHQITMSALIEERAPQVREPCPHHANTGERRRALQTIGTRLREKYNSDYIAHLAIEKIAFDRVHNQGYSQSGAHTLMRAERRWRVHIIDALKNPE